MMDIFAVLGGGSVSGWVFAEKSLSSLHCCMEDSDGRLSYSEDNVVSHPSLAAEIMIFKCRGELSKQSE